MDIIDPHLSEQPLNGITIEVREQRIVEREVETHFCFARELLRKVEQSLIL